MKLFKKLFPSVSDDVADAKSDTDQLQIATCLLLIEVSKSDDDFTKDEEEKIKSLLKEDTRPFVVDLIIFFPKVIHITSVTSSTVDNQAYSVEG